MINWIKSFFKKDTIGCQGTTIRVNSGAYVDTINPDPSTIFIEDIAHGLSNICRFNGHTSDHYSVAEHSLHCAHMAMQHGETPDVVFACLMHDSGEAFLSDISKPLKRKLRQYCLYEKRMEDVIGQKFGFDLDKHYKAYKFYDNCMLFHEKRHVFEVPAGEQWTGESSFPSPNPLFPLMSLSRQDIKDEFLYAFHSLKDQTFNGLFFYKSAAEKIFVLLADT